MATMSAETPSRGPGKAAAVFVPKPIPRRYRAIAEYSYRTAAERDSFVERVLAYRHRSASTGCVHSAEVYKPFLYDLLEFLKACYRAELARHESVHPEQVCLEFRPGRKQYSGCCPERGQIVFSEDLIQKHLVADAVSGYRAERPVMQRWVRSKEDALMWHVLHEFVHVFHEGAEHDEAFVARVEQLARENAFLFSAPP